MRRSQCRRGRACVTNFNIPPTEPRPTGREEDVHLNDTVRKATRTLLFAVLLVAGLVAAIVFVSYVLDYIIYFVMHAAS